MTRTHFVGDSITAAGGDPGGGWVGRVCHDLGASGVNHGVPGSRSVDLLASLPTDLGDLGPGEACVVAIGINDLHPMARDGAALAEVLVRLGAAYDRMTDEIRSRGGRPVFVELTPVDELAIDELTGEPAGRGRSNADVDAVNRLLAEHCQRHGVPLIRVCAALRRRDLDTVLEDGLHPSPAGYDVMASAAAAVLRPLIEAPGVSTPGD